MKKRIVGMRELDAYSAAMAKFIKQHEELQKAFNAAHLIHLANAAAGNLDASLAAGLTALSEAPKAFEALVAELEPAARAFLGEGRNPCESAMDYCSRLTTMTQAQMFKAQARNGITFLTGAR